MAWMLFCAPLYTNRQNPEAVDNPTLRPDTLPLLSA